MQIIPEYDYRHRYTDLYLSPIFWGAGGSLLNRRISGAESETRYTSAERDREGEARDEKNPPVVAPLFKLHHPLSLLAAGFFSKGH